MYDLKPEVVKPGCTLRELITHRKETGYFTGRRRAVLSATSWTASRRENPSPGPIEASDGRIVNVVNQPMASGGWVATHEDVTEQRKLRAAARRDDGAGRQAHHDRCRDPEFPRACRERSQDRGRQRRHDEIDRQQAARRLGPDLAARRKRRAGLERGLDQRHDRGDRYRRAVQLDRRDLAPARPDHRRGAHGGERSGSDQCADHRARRSRAEDRRRGGTDPQYRRTDQPAGAQRHDRGRARRRGRAAASRSSPRR